MKESTLACLRAYADERVPPGGFLEAVLSNDLRSAVSRADPENLSDLNAIVRYCHWEIPGDCWGSREKVAAWLAMSKTPAVLRSPPFLIHDDDSEYSPLDDDRVVALASAHRAWFDAQQAEAVEHDSPEGWHELAKKNDQRLRGLGSMVLHLYPR